jgi:hypothetical protein
VANDDKPHRQSPHESSPKTQEDVHDANPPIDACCPDGADEQVERHAKYQRRIQQGVEQALVYPEIEAAKHCETTLPAFAAYAPYGQLGQAKTGGLSVATNAIARDRRIAHPAESKYRLTTCPCRPSRTHHARPHTALSTLCNPSLARCTLLGLPLPGDAAAEAAPGPGWLESSTDLRHGLEVVEVDPVEGKLEQWLALWQLAPVPTQNGACMRSSATARPSSITAIA